MGIQIWWLDQQCQFQCQEDHIHSIHQPPSRWIAKHKKGFRAHVFHVSTQRRTSIHLYQSRYWATTSWCQCSPNKTRSTFSARGRDNRHDVWGSQDSAWERRHQPDFYDPDLASQCPYPLIQLHGQTWSSCNTCTLFHPADHDPGFRCIQASKCRSSKYCQEDPSAIR